MMFRLKIPYHLIPKLRQGGGLYVGPSHDRGGIPVNVAGRPVEVEGDEYKICRDAYNSPEILHLVGKTNLEVLHHIHHEFSCKFEQHQADPGDFIICKRVVGDDVRKDRKGTVKQILNEMQGEGGCKVEAGGTNGKFSEGGELPVMLRTTRESESEPQLTLLSFGGGQDSWAILLSIINDPAFRKKYAPHDFVVAMSDTGNEFPYTYAFNKKAAELCKKNGIHFQFITPDQGWHTPGWQSLDANLKRNKIILGAAMGNKSCTVSLKVHVVDKYMHHYMCTLYGFPEKVNKASWDLYRQRFGTKARVLIGFAADEEGRVIRSNKMHESLPKWKKESIQYVYPLVEEGWNRAAAQGVIRKYQPEVPPPSNCMKCFYQSDQELLWLDRNHPEQLLDWIQMEKTKLDRFAGIVDKNYGVYGTITLPQKLERAKQKFGHLTDAELWEYKMSHGHCIKSAY